MAKPVWSIRFMHARSPAGTYTYTVPAGKIAVVRSLTYAWVNAETREFFVRRSGVVFYTAKPTGSTYGGATAEMRQVLYAGELLELILQGVDLGCMISGYLLDELAGQVSDAPEIKFEPYVPSQLPAEGGVTELPTGGRGRRAGVQRGVRRWGLVATHPE